MIEKLEWFFIGFAGLFEIVLLLLLCQPINRSHVAPWLKWLVGGAFLFHLGYFARLFLFRERAETAAVLDQGAMLVLCSGLLLMPSAMLHAALRLRSIGSAPLKPLPASDWRFGLVYLPLLAIVPAGWFILSGSRGDFMASVAPLAVPYVVWLTIANLISATLFLRQTLGSALATRRAFFGWIGVLLLMYAAGAANYAFITVGTPWEVWARILVGIAPLFPSILFVWYTLKSRLLPVVFEQSIVYGGIVLTLLLFHRLAVTPLTIWLRERFDVDFIVLEVIAVAALVWWIRPLRRRASESLRFLLSPNAFRVRDATRQLALDVAQLSNVDIRQRCDWFAQQLKERFELVWVRVISNDLSSQGSAYCFHGYPEFAKQVPDEPVRHIVEHWGPTPLPIERGEEGNPNLANAMEELECDVALPMFYKNVRGAVLFGSRQKFDRLADEQITSLSVLVDQFATTLQNQHDEEIRRLAERKSLQQEKLSTLGLISGSLAHELRNPMSSIRTIASLVHEELGPEAPQKEDLKLIVSEVDRLTQTLQRVLDFARPTNPVDAETEPDVILSRLIAIMDYLAKEHGVTLNIQLQAIGAKVKASDQAINEIFMNLIKNAIEASSRRPDASVTIQSTVEADEFVARIIDRGVGIAPERLSTVFRPFETNKPTGTGLGLYIVSERVKELRGRINLQSNAESGTTFEVRLPNVNQEA